MEKIQEKSNTITDTTCEFPTFQECLEIVDISKKHLKNASKPQNKQILVPTES